MGQRTRDRQPGAQLRSVLDDEDVVRVGAELGHGIALGAGPDGQGVEAEHLQQHPSGLLIAAGDIDPDESVVTGKQPLQLPDRIRLDAFIGHKANVHPARHLLGAVIPALSLAPPRPRRLSSRAEHKDLAGARGSEAGARGSHLAAERRSVLAMAQNHDRGEAGGAGLRRRRDAPLSLRGAYRHGGRWSIRRWGVVAVTAGLFTLGAYLARNPSGGAAARP
jgi:hypothetical protein